MTKYFLVNRSQSTVSVPWFEREDCVNYRGFPAKRTKFMTVSPGESVCVGENLSPAARKHYRQVESLGIFLKAVPVKEEVPDDEEIIDPFEGESGEPEGDAPEDSGEIEDEAGAEAEGEVYPDGEATPDAGELSEDADDDESDSGEDSVESGEDDGADAGAPDAESSAVPVPLNRKDLNQMRQSDLLVLARHFGMELDANTHRMQIISKLMEAHG